MTPARIGDDIINSDRCSPGMKFNLRLGKCIPADAYVSKDGTVTMAQRQDYAANNKLSAELSSPVKETSKRKGDKRMADPNVLKRELKASKEPHPAKQRVLDKMTKHPSKHLSQNP